MLTSYSFEMSHFSIVQIQNCNSSSMFIACMLIRIDHWSTNIVVTLKAVSNIWTVAKDIIIADEICSSIQFMDSILCISNLIESRFILFSSFALSTILSK